LVKIAIFAQNCTMANNEWKERLGVVFSTNPNYSYEKEDEPEQKTFAPNKQRLSVTLDKRNRAGKQVTLIKGFVGKEADLNELGRLVRSRCGTGGSVKDGEIIIQGDFRSRIVSILQTMGYKV